MTGHLAALVLGFAGSLHCVAMCGPLAGAVAPAFGRGIVAGTIYQAGRMSTYVLVGIAAGAAGGVLAGFAGLGRVVSVAAGAVMLVTAAGQAARWRPAATGWWAGRLGRLLARAAAIRAARPRTSAFAAGALNGALPCGLVYAAAIVAATAGNAVSGATLMLTFGAGTIPAMMAAWMATSFVPSTVRRRLRFVTPVVLVVVGLMLIGRGMESSGTTGSTGATGDSNPQLHQH